MTLKHQMPLLQVKVLDVSCEGNFVAGGSDFVHTCEGMNWIAS
jgi:hypothetical protein